MNDNKMRLQKYMALCGVASRRASEEIIKEGRVQVNYKAVVDMGILIDPKKDRVLVDGKRIRPEENKIYIALNKPLGVVTSVKEATSGPIN